MCVGCLKDAHFLSFDSIHIGCRPSLCCHCAVPLAPGDTLLPFERTTPSRHISPSSIWQLLCLHPPHVRMHECRNQYFYNSVLMGMRYNGSRYSMLHRARGGVVHRRHTNTRNAFDRNFGWRSGIRGGKYAGEAQDRTGVIV